MKILRKLNVVRALTVLSLVIMASCTAPVATGITDPHEAKNRYTHEGNRNLDKTLVGPAAGAYGNGLPAPVRRGIGNFASNLNLPSVVVNNILQLRLGKALKNTSRFLINSTIGLAGVLDPSTAMGLDEENSDFGETLHIWGVGEGNYVELPFVGPSTERDMVGMVVDMFTNPLTFGAGSPEKYMSPVIKGFSKLGDRYEYSDTIDTILYNSADSYAQARLIYLQHRRFKLGQALGTDQPVEEGEDAYDDFYAD